ncbi:MAG: tripartite tricarboxylate transporter substrate-binding protein [Deltaproteobacteria bacterium]|nr:tripartite tricarboxylate transporter substrate-binding protein [Deltaproteobacteria bacterium]
MGLKGFMKKRFVKAVAVVGVAILLAPVGLTHAFAAGCYGEKATVNWIVPYSPGGGFDTYSRLIEPFYEKHAGAEVVVRNVTGAGGINGSRELFRSKPDGHTLGILFGSGVIVANLIGKIEQTLSDFTLLGRIAPEEPVWALGKDSAYKDIWHILKSDKDIVGVTTGAGSASFFDNVVSAELIGVYKRYKAVTGFKGSRQATMAVIRNEADMGDYNYSSIRDRIDSGDLRPVMSVTPERVGQDNPKMKGVPTIFEVLKKTGRENRIEDAKSLTSVDKVARVIAAPPGIEPKLLKCMEDKLFAAMNDDGFKAAAKKAKRPIDPANAEELREPLKLAVEGGKKFAPLYKKAVAKIGG